MENLKALADLWEDRGDKAEAGKMREGLDKVGEVKGALDLDFPEWSDSERLLAAIVIAGAVI